MWFLYTKPDNCVVIDFKKRINVKEIKIRGILHDNNWGYPWDENPPSYALEFSNDNKAFKTMFSEYRSERITKDNLITVFPFSMNISYRYFRLRIIDYTYESDEHGLYVSWLDFLTNPLSLFSLERNPSICYYNLFPILILIELDDSS